MRKIEEVYDIMKEVRERIINTMDERGINELRLCMDEEEWLENYKDFDEDDYPDYRYQSCPPIIYFDKYGNAYEYFVEKVILKEKDKRSCFNDFIFEANGYEVGTKEISEYDVFYLSMIYVYGVLEKILKLN